jgi:phosphopantothenoylcysteine synthetase/decarboxylase
MGETPTISKPEHRVLIVSCGSVGIVNLPQYLIMLKAAHISVRCIMTPMAEKFVPAQTVRCFVDKVATGFISNDGALQSLHIEWPAWADHVVVLPASANTIAKMAAGISDTLASAALVATTVPLWVFPNMEASLAKSPATQDNLKVLESRGVTVKRFSRKTLSVSSGELHPSSWALPSLGDFKNFLDNLFPLGATAGASQESPI